MVNLAPAPAPDDVPVTFVNVALPVEVPEVTLTVFTGLLFSAGFTPDTWSAFVGSMEEIGPITLDCC